MNIKHKEYSPNKVSGQSEDKWNYKPNENVHQDTAAAKQEQHKNYNHDMDQNHNK